MKQETQVSFDVVVVGAGHAGLEAATAAARMGAIVGLVTLDHANVGVMSCNPAFGGLGKGHLVREIDALDGCMGRWADQAGIQFRLLNAKKGAAVQGLRAQADRQLYRKAAITEIDSYPNLSLLTAEVTGLDFRHGRVGGVRTTAGALQAGAVVLTTGTFLNGMIHIGERSFPAGRIGEKAATGISGDLAALGLSLARLKTGTPPRVDGRTIDWNEVGLQEGDADPMAFSPLSGHVGQDQVTCGITKTTAATHDVIRRHVHRSAVYNGNISGRGPRYCPSIEDKIVRFGDRDGHQIFLEPEGLGSPLIYPNGISTSLPAEVQDAIVQSLPGLSRARIVQHGYAIEYDYVDPRELTASLQTKKCAGLFLAGQINGTTGYEEAGAQGLVAGINAARFASGSTMQIFDRSQSYIGVMIDDLVTHGVSEPYRMFTSRAEFRLSIRSDNADRRLTPVGLDVGCVRGDRKAWFVAQAERFGMARAQLDGLAITPLEAEVCGIALNRDGQRRSAWMLLASHTNFDGLVRVWPQLAAIAPDVRRLLEIEAKYSVYTARQDRERAALAGDREVAIPTTLVFRGMAGLSNELAEKLERVRPTDIAHAARIEGMTPAALSLVAAHAKRGGSRRGSHS